MTTLAQATFVGSTLIIRCDSRWGCCQRAQAKAKVKAMNYELTPPPNRYIKDLVSDQQNAWKEEWQSGIKRDYKKASASEQQEMAREAGAPECLVEQLDGRPLSEQGLQADHPLDTKLGGPCKPSVGMPLDADVNHAFGIIAKAQGDKMRAAGETQVEKIDLICPADDDGCTDENHSVGHRKKMPEGPEHKKRKTEIDRDTVMSW